MSERARRRDRPPPVDASRARPSPARARSTTTLFSHRFPPRSPRPSPRARPHDASPPLIVISTRCRGRSVARVTRMRSRAGAVKRPRASSSRAVRTERRRGRGERTTRRTSTRDSHRASPAPRRSRARRRVRASFPHPNVIHRARIRGNDARDIHSTRARRPSSVVVEARRERERKKTGARRVPRSLDSRVRSFARARATMCGATTALGARFVSSSRPVASLHFFIRARGYRVEACVKTMYVCEWFDTVKKRKKRRRRPVYVL